MNIRVHSPLMENSITLTEKNQIFLLYCYVQILVPIFSIFSAHRFSSWLKVLTIADNKYTGTHN